MKMEKHLWDCSILIRTMIFIIYMEKIMRYFFIQTVILSNPC